MPFTEKGWLGISKHKRLTSGEVMQQGPFGVMYKAVYKKKSLQITVANRKLHGCHISLLKCKS